MVQKDHVINDTDLPFLHLHYVRSRCAEESGRFFHRQAFDPRFCFELFRRAICLRDQQAWEYVYLQYRPLVAGWVERHPLFPALDEEVDFFVNRVFEKLWALLTPEKFSLSPGLSGLLSYLRKCVNSVLVDTMRGHERFELFGEEGEEGEAQNEGEPVAYAQEPPEQAVLHQEMAEKLWAMLLKRCRDEKERAAAYGFFVLALKASEVYEENPGVFDSAQEVYRVKANLLVRLKRDQAFLNYLEG